MVELKFLNKNLELVGIIDTATSVQWKERFFEVGTFEIYVQIDDYVKNILLNSFFVIRNDSERVGVIRYFDKLTNVEEGDYVTIIGKFAEDLIGQRIIRYKRNFIEYSHSDIIIALLNDNLLKPPLNPGESISPRKISIFDTTINDYIDSMSHINAQPSYEESDNLLEYILQLLADINASLKVTLNDNNKLQITLFNGINRSVSQTKNSFVLFSKNFDNLISSNFTKDTTEAKNVVYVGGEDDETREEGRIIEKYDKNSDDEIISDLDRVEVYVDASDIEQQSTDEWNVLQPKLSDKDYRQLLINRAKENVILPSEILEAIVDTSLYKYGANKDYYLGDIVTIEDEIFGSYNKMLIGMDFVDEEISTMEPIFDDNTVKANIIIQREIISEAPYAADSLYLESLDVDVIDYLITINDFGRTGMRPYISIGVYLSNDEYMDYESKELDIDSTYTIKRVNNNSFEVLENDNVIATNVYNYSIESLEIIIYDNGDSGEYEWNGYIDRKE